MGARFLTNLEMKDYNCSMQTTSTSRAFFFNNFCFGPYRSCNCFTLECTMYKQRTQIIESSEILLMVFNGFF